MIETRARVLERGRRLQKGLKVRLFQSGEVEIRRRPDGNWEWIVGVVEETLNDRDVLVFVTLDLLDQLRVQACQLFGTPRRGPSSS